MVLGSVLSVSPLKGLTNRVYRVATADGDFVLRLPRPENAGLIDREAEAHNLALACEHGIALPALVLDPRSGILLTRAIEQDLPQRVEPSALGRLVARLHAAPLRFQGAIDPDHLITRQRAALANRPDLLSVFDPLDGILVELGTVGGAHAPVPSHGDLSPGNILAGSDGPVLIDWEYSAMASPAWDLAYAVLEHEFDETEEQSFLSAYAASRPGIGDLGPEIFKMKIRCDAVSVLWALGQAMKANGSADFHAFAWARKERALKTYATLSDLRK